MDKPKLALNDTYTEQFRISQKEVDLFAALSGDKNPIHLDPKFAAGTIFKQTIVHGSLATAVFSKILGMEFPGEGTVFFEQHYKFLMPVFTEQDYIADLRVIEKKEEKNRAVIQCAISHKDSGKTCIEGSVLISNKTRL